MTLKPLLITAILLSLSFTCKTQVYLETALNLLEQQKLQEYIQNQINNNIHTFSEISPSLDPSADVSDYNHQTLDYFFRSKSESLWEHYLNTPTVDAWSSRKINLNLLFSRKDKQLYKDGELSPKMETGQIIYLDLNFLFGLHTLVMAFEITHIDSENKVIEFSYIKGNKSEGKQQLQFLETGKGNTRILHTSYYKSESFLRDRFIYPYFHKKVTNDFHRNMKKML